MNARMDDAPSDFRLLEVSGRALRSGPRFDAWRDLLSRKLLGVNGRALADDRFNVDARLRILPGLRCGTGMLAASRYDRDRQLVASDNDDFVLVVNLNGGFVASQCGRELALGPGDGFLLACAEPGTFVRQSAGHLTCIRFPAQAIAPRVSKLYDRVGRRIPKGSDVLGLLLSYVRAMDGMALEDAHLRETAVRHVHELVTLALNPSRENLRERGNGGLRNGLLSAIKRYAERNLSSPNLSLEDIAPLFGLSPRQIQRLFAGDGRTFSRFVVQQRLERVYRALTDNGQRHKNISDIALECGFGDVSSFNRAFRDHFGETPRDVRSRADAGLSRDR